MQSNGKKREPSDVDFFGQARKIPSWPSSM
jgi:hypothetical protein